MKKLFEGITIVSDVDGIMTSSELGYSNQGKVMKYFSVNDSLMVDFFKNHLGVKIIALTGDVGSGFEISSLRCNQLKIEIRHCFNIGKLDYIKANFDPKKVVYFGDDIYDFLIFEEVLASGTVKNAPDFLRSEATFVVNTIGGQSALTALLIETYRHLAQQADPNLDVLALDEHLKEELRAYMLLKSKPTVKNVINALNTIV